MAWGLLTSWQERLSVKCLKVVIEVKILSWGNSQPQG